MMSQNAKEKEKEQEQLQEQQREKDELQMPAAGSALPEEPEDDPLAELDDLDPLADGDIGVFCVDGESYIKQYHYDRMLGMTYLFSLNRKRSNMDIVLPSNTGRSLACLGRVITKRKYPVPGSK